MIFRILFATLFIRLLRAQITFTDPISSGTSCTTEDMGDGFRMNCTGLGFLTADAMSLKTATTMYVTILSSTPVAAVGLGERVGGADVWCKTTDFPATASGKTWASKSLSSLNNCCYNMITMYTSSASTYAAVKPYQAAVIGNTYKWVFTPAIKSYTCWQVDISMPYPDGSFTDWTDSPGFVCTSSKSFYYASNIILAPYFELEGSGTTSFYIQSELCSAISDCISCPGSSTCQFCRPGYQMTECGTCTNSNNLTCPIIVDPTDPSDGSDDEESTPGEEESMPGEEESTPGGEESTSGEEESTPGEEGSIPGEEESTPGEEESMPGEEESTPGGEESTSGEEESTPGEEETPEESNQESGNGATPQITIETAGGDYVTKIIAVIALVIGLTLSCVALLFCKQIVHSLSTKRNNITKKGRKDVRKVYPSPSQAELYPSLDLDNGKKSTPRNNNTTNLVSSLSNIKEDEGLFDYTKRSTLPRSRVFVKRPLSKIVDEVQEEVSVVVLTK